MKARGLIDDIARLPANLVLEGAGDCVFDQTRNLFWMGYGPRSDAAARHVVAEQFGHEVVALELADARFYHMDTALCPLSGGEVMYFADAFTPAGLAQIHSRVAPGIASSLLPRTAAFSRPTPCASGRTSSLSGAGERLCARLEERGYRALQTALPSFLRSGGSAFCLTLRLDRQSVAAVVPSRRAAVA